MAPLATLLMYHDVREPADSRWPRRYAADESLRPAELAGQLDRLVATGRPVVTVAAIVAALAGGPPLPEGAVALSFDHGLADHYRTVLPLLTARGLVGSFFLPAAPIAERRVIAAHKIQFVLAAADSEQDVVAAVYDLVAEYRRSGTARSAPPMAWDGHGENWSRQIHVVTRLLRSGLPAALRGEVIDRLFYTFVTDDETAFADDLYLSPAEASALAAAGMEIGGQGLSGTNLQGLPHRAQQAEITATAAFLTRKLGRGEGLLFSYPDGGWDEAALELLPTQGFIAGLTTHPGDVGADTDPFRLPRYNATRDFHRIWGG